MRLLELRTIERLKKYGSLPSDEFPSKVYVDQFYGIEVLEFPVQIAKVVMWMMDHIMNQRMSEALGRFEREQDY